MTGNNRTRIGVVAIGRNEGERLRACLESVRGQGLRVVYVDSASSDGSVAAARALGANVVELDMTRPFSAARARNEGLARLREAAPEVELVQFVDGDCILVEGWIDLAADYLEKNPKAAVVCGRRRERFPEASKYNRLCDMEWNTPVGETKSCGGDALMRVSALAEAGGFDPTVMAGEEPELCQRLRKAGWKIFRLDHEMTLHDAAITRFGQFWKRMVRGGYGMAQLAQMAASDGRGGTEPSRRRIVSAAFWGVGVPGVFLASLAAGAFWRPAWWGAAGALALWLVLLARCWRFGRKRGGSAGAALLHAWFMVPVKAAHCQGIWRFVRSHVGKRPSVLIEYKESTAENREAAAEK